MAEDKPVHLSKQDLTDIVTAATIAARQPSPEEQAKKKAEDERKARRRELMLKARERGEYAALRTQENCTHTKPDGSFAMGGQSFSNGREKKLCLRCGKWLYDQPTPEMAMAEAELKRRIDQGKVRVVNGKVEMSA